MSRLFGPLRQMRYVVRDIEAAMRHWVEVCGVWPWFYADRLPLTALQHWSSWPEDYDAIYRRALASGYAVGQTGDSPRGRFVSFAAEGHPGTVIEMADLTPARRRIFDQVRAAAQGWDRREPIRRQWPT